MRDVVICLTRAVRAGRKRFVGMHRMPHSQFASQGRPDEAGAIFVAALDNLKSGMHHFVTLPRPYQQPIFAAICSALPLAPLEPGPPTAQI